MFVEAFLGTLLALLVIAAAKWTLIGPIFAWRMRRAGRGMAIALQGIDFEGERARYKREMDEQEERERKLLAAEIVRQMKTSESSESVA